LTKIRNYGYIPSMRNVSMLKDRRRQVQTGQSARRDKESETPPDTLSGASPVKAAEGYGRLRKANEGKKK
jgi:hypothetical protein